LSLFNVISESTLRLGIILISLTLLTYSFRFSVSDRDTFGDFLSQFHLIDLSSHQSPMRSVSPHHK
jgi:hypothetical protein